MAFLPCVLLSAGGPTRVGACTIRPRMALRGRSPEQRDAELQAQKEILERRRNEKKSAQYMESVASRRAEAEAFFQSNQLDIQPGEDPLEAWKRKEARGLIDQAHWLRGRSRGRHSAACCQLWHPKIRQWRTYVSRRSRTLAGQPVPTAVDLGSATCVGAGGPYVVLVDWSSSRALSLLDVFWAGRQRLCTRLTLCPSLLHVVLFCRCVFYDEIFTLLCVPVDCGPGAL